MRLLLSAVSTNWLRLRTSKSLIGAGLDAMAANERVGHLANGGLHQRLTHRLHVDLIGKARQPRLQIVRIGRRQIGPIERRLLRGRRGDAEHFAFGRRERHHDKIVLIRAEGRLALGDQHADHLQRHALDLDEGADRVFAGTEQLAVHRLPDDDDEVGLVFVLGRDAAPGGDPPVGDRRVVCAHALDGRRPILVAVLHLALLADEVADLRDRGILAADRARIRNRQRGGAAEAGADAARGQRAGQDHDDVGAEALDLLADRLAGAIAHGDHDDERGDADEDAEHGERRTHLVASDRLGRGGEDHEREGEEAAGRKRRGARLGGWKNAGRSLGRGGGAAALPVWLTRSSETISPSRMVTMRSA